MKPMLAADCEGNTRLLKYPLLASPKLDGIRALTSMGGVISRSLKLIPNQFVQECLWGVPKHLDGELIVGNPTAPSAYRDTMSGVMSDDGTPDFKFYVFDRFDVPLTPYASRYASLEKQFINPATSKRVILLPHQRIENEPQLLMYEASCLERGYEGVMVRSLDGPYKHGRATLREGYLTKVKRFMDAEAEVLAVKELLHNENEAKRNALGHLERSSHKAGKRASGMLGALVCRLPGTDLTFDIGTGFTEVQRKQLWAERRSLVGQWAKYRYFPTGSKERPRFPVWLGFRDEGDM